MTTISLIDDKLHRLDGPAVELGDIKLWFLDGLEYQVTEDKEVRRWERNGKLHNPFGPAIEWSDGSKTWWVYGKRHRLDGPAVTWVNGDKFWYQHDKLHRIGKPAVMLNGGEIEYWEFGIKYHVTETKSHRAWHVNGLLHRGAGLPAIEYKDGGKCWFDKGKRHRLGGPAIVDNEYESWYIDGVYQKGART